MRLFHFSEDPTIAIFAPRPVAVPSPRAPGCDWLNGPLVWAIDEWHQPLYLFPRECPRILIWPTAETTRHDYDKYWGERSNRMIAFAERAWSDALHTTPLYRYEFSSASFEDIHDTGMWVSRDAVCPNSVEQIDSLPAAQKNNDVELRLVDSLLPLKDIWESSMHASGIRLRNAAGWTS